MFKRYCIWPSLSPLVFASLVTGTVIFTRKSPFVITLRFIKEGVWSLYRLLFFDTLIPPFVISFFWTLRLLTGSFQNRSLTHLRCSHWSFYPAVTLSVALPVEFSFLFFIHIFGPTGFFLFSTFSIFSRTRFLFYTFLYIRIELLWEWDLCFLSIPPQIPKDWNLQALNKTASCICVSHGLST